MTYEEMQRSIESHDRQLDAIIQILATVSESLASLERTASIQNERIKRLEDKD
jgi:hypothetical protein